MKETIKPFIVLGIVVAVVVGSLYALVRWTNSTPNQQGTSVKTDTSVVTMEGDTQVVTILARGGYFPNKVSAKAGINTVLRMKVGNSFDCSSSVRIDAINYNQRLNPGETTDIQLGVPSKGPLNGMCSMGMYGFEIDFI